MFITLSKRHSWLLHLGSLWCWTTEPHSGPYSQRSGTTTCVVKAVSLHRLLCTCKMLPIKKPKAQKHAYFFFRQIQLLLLKLTRGDNSRWKELCGSPAKAVVRCYSSYDCNPWNKNCAFRSLWGSTEDCPGSAGKAAWLWYRKQTQIHVKTKVTPKGWSLSDMSALQWHEFQCYSLYSEAYKVRRDVKGEM